MSGGFSPLPHAGHEISEADTHVESCGDVLSDAGSTPAASTNFSRICSRIRASSSAVPAASTISPLTWVLVAPNSGRLLGDRAISLKILRAEILGKPTDRGGVRTFPPPA